MQTPRIDPEKIEELKMLVDEDDPDFLVELIEDYITNTVDGLKTIRYAIQAKDTVTVVKAAHTLKGASSNMGAVNMAELTNQLEAIGREKSLTGADEIIDRLDEEFFEVKTDLKSV